MLSNISVQLNFQVLLEKTVPMLTSIIESPVDKVPQALVSVNIRFLKLL